MTSLVVITPFLSYQKGDIISDTNTINSILSNPDYNQYVVQVNNIGSQSSGGTGTTTTVLKLSSNLGSILLDNSTIYVDSNNTLHTVVNPLTYSLIISALGYVPIDPVKIGQSNGLAVLDSQGKLLSSELPTSISGAVIYQGNWDANLNSPGLQNGVGTKGYYYKVAVAGSTPIDGNTVWSVGDLLIFNGTTWDKIAANLNPSVSSFNTRTGNITLTTNDIVNTLGYLPYSSNNPNGYISTASLPTMVNTVNGRSGTVVITPTDLGLSTIDGGFYGTSGTVYDGAFLGDSSTIQKTINGGFLTDNFLNATVHDAGFI